MNGWWTGLAARIRRFFGLSGGVYPSTAASGVSEVAEGWSPDPTPGDSALEYDLDTLVAQCRDLDRRSAKARALIHGFRADLVGSGIDVEPLGLSDDALAAVRAAWHEWAEQASVDGESLWSLQWTAAGELMVAGQSLWRWVAVEDGGPIPLRLLPLEAEWLSPVPLREVPPERFVHGVEVDRLGRVVAYHLRDPLAPESSGEVVPAADIVHAFIRTRARQHLGEPLLAPLIVRLLQDERLVLTELRAAVNSAAVSGVIETEDADLLLDAGGATAAPNAPRRLRPGAVLALRPGERWQTVKNDRPAQQLAPFRSSLDGDLAGGAGLSRQWLDRDSARANYSSMREDNLRTARVLGPMQLQFGRRVAGAVFERLAPYLELRTGVLLGRPVRYELRPDRIAYVDPQKEAEADVYQISHALASHEEVLAARGKDLATVLQKRREEQDREDRDLLARIQRWHALAEASGIPGLTWTVFAQLAGQPAVPPPAAEAPADAVEVERDADGRIRRIVQRPSGISGLTR